MKRKTLLNTFEYKAMVYRRKYTPTSISRSSRSARNGGTDFSGDQIHSVDNPQHNLPPPNACLIKAILRLLSFCSASKQLAQIPVVILRSWRGSLWPSTLPQWHLTSITITSLFVPCLELHSKSIGPFVLPPLQDLQHHLIESHPPFLLASALAIVTLPFLDEA